MRPVPAEKQGRSTVDSTLRPLSSRPMGSSPAGSKASGRSSVTQGQRGGCLRSPGTGSILLRGLEVRLASREAADWDQEALGGLPHATLHLPRVGAPCCEALPRQVEQELGSVGSTLPLCRAGPGSTREWRPVRHQATLPVAQNFLCRHIAGPGQAITPEQCQRPVGWRPHPRHSSHLS